MDDFEHLVKVTIESDKLLDKLLIDGILSPKKHRKLLKQMNILNSKGVELRKRLSLHAYDEGKKNKSKTNQGESTWLNRRYEAQKAKLSEMIHAKN